MNLGKNITYLRRQSKLSQDELAEKMSVSRQTVSRWETEDATPEIEKLIRLADLFNCKVDALLREDMEARHDIYSDVGIRTIPAFKMARYVMITPNPEDDVNAYMRTWAERCGITAFCNGNLKMIGWDFPFVSSEQQNRFGLRGYVSAVILPENYENTLTGAEIAEQPESSYAVITITDPFVAAFERIPEAYKRILNHLGTYCSKDCTDSNSVSCFETIYEKDGMTFMDVFVRTDSTTRSGIPFSFFE